MTDTQLLDIVADLVARASVVILDIRARGFQTQRKADASVVTEADHAAEALIVAGLRAATPGMAVVAEEEIAAGHVPNPGEVFWLVDPLDGTREFAAGRDDFAVCVGLVRDRRAVLGVVALPAYGEVFAGIVGHGAWKRDAAGQRPITTRPMPAAGIDCVASRHYATDPRIAHFLEGRTVASVRNMGSAVKFCRVAEGTADLYPRFGRTMEWDTAAPQAVVEAAGGSVRLLEGGETLLYGKPAWENPSFVCTGYP
jgi:3'(2'), 5'-bisphosphate nucleotidase